MATTFVVKSNQLAAPENLCPNCLATISRPYYIVISDAVEEKQKSKGRAQGQSISVSWKASGSTIINVAFCEICYEQFHYIEDREKTPGRITTIAMVIAALFFFAGLASCVSDVMQPPQRNVAVYGPGGFSWGPFVLNTAIALLIVVIGGVIASVAAKRAAGTMDQTAKYARERAQSAVTVSMLDLSTAEVTIRESRYASVFKRLNNI